MRKVYFAAFILMFAIAGASSLAVGQNKSELVEPTFTLLSPRAGTVLRAGDRVEIKWEMTLDQSIIENEWAEMELVLENDEGLNMRISPQMNVTARSAMWTVPNVRTETARIVMQCGIEGEGEMYRFVQPNTFSIRVGKINPGIVVLLPADEGRAGSNLDIRWTSTLERGTTYDIMVSHDQGAHYYKAGTTTDTRFSLHIDERLAGSMLIQVVGRRPNGTRVESLVDRSTMVKILDKQD